MNEGHFSTDFQGGHCPIETNKQAKPKKAGKRQQSFNATSHEEMFLSTRPGEPLSDL